MVCHYAYNQGDKMQNSLIDTQKSEKQSQK